MIVQADADSLLLSSALVILAESSALRRRVQEYKSALLSLVKLFRTECSARQAYRRVLQASASLAFD
jgi:hypothetical protein